MIPAADNTSVRTELEQLLASTRKRVHHAMLRDAARVAIDRSLTAMACVAGGYLVLRLTCLILQHEVPFGWAAYAGLLVAGFVVPVLVTAIGGIQRLPSFREAAERLDLAASDHNRIATALALAGRGDRTEFGIAAMQDGLMHLQRLQEVPPYVTPTRAGWWDRAYRGTAILVLTLAAMLCGNAPNAADAGRNGALALARPRTDRRAAGELEDRQRDTAKAEVAQSQPAMSGEKKKGQMTPTVGQPPAGTRNDPAAGRASGETRAEANPSDRSASARGDSTDATANAQSAKKKDVKSSPPKPSKESRVANAQKPEKPEESSSIGQGTSGGGAMSAVQNAWSQRDHATEGDREEDESQENVEDENESNTQRGGVQPSLKDRNESPSKELGISGEEEGPPGTGRGGPTPPKKSRGVASLVLGVPVPDFVKGRVGPGTTKVTHERVEPSPMPGDPTRPVAVAGRSLDESPDARYDVPAAFSALVQRYLVALHSADQKAPAPSGGKTEPRP